MLIEFTHMDYFQDAWVEKPVLLNTRHIIRVSPKKEKEYNTVIRYGYNGGSTLFIKETMEEIKQKVNLRGV